MNISVAASLEGVEYHKDFKPSEETKKRMSTLGLEAFLSDQVDTSKTLELLEASVWKSNLSQ